MGIKGLLPVLLDITNKTQLKDLGGLTVGVDGIAW